MEGEKVNISESEVRTGFGIVYCMLNSGKYNQNADIAGIIGCPFCKDEHVHFKKPVYLKGDDLDLSGYPFRGPGIIIPMECENGHSWKLYLGFHEGYTSMFIVKDKLPKDDPIYVINEKIERLEKEKASVLSKKHEAYQIYKITASIRRLKNRKKQIEDMKALGRIERVENGVKIVEDPDIERIQLFFGDIPCASIREELKRNGFVWAPNRKAWQRRLTDSGKCAAKYIVKKVAELKS